MSLKFITRGWCPRHLRRCGSGTTSWKLSWILLKYFKYKYTWPDSCESIPIIAKVPRPTWDHQALLWALLTKIGRRNQSWGLEEETRHCIGIGDNRLMRVSTSRSNRTPAILYSSDWFGALSNVHLSLPEWPIVCQVRSERNKLTGWSTD